MKKLTLFLVFIFTALAGTVQATDYVFKYTTGGTTYYLARNGTTGTTAVTTYNESTCVWTCVNGTTETSLSTSASYSLIQKVNGTTYYLRSGTTLGFNTTNQAAWRLNNGNLVYYANNTNYYVYYNNGSFRYSATYNTYKNKQASSAVVYSITCNSAVGGTVTANYGKAPAGMSVTLTATPATGYEFDSYNVATATVNGNSFTMPASNVTVTAKFVARAKAPTIAPASGSFTEASKDITITNNETGATVYYTTDGTDPTTASASFTGTSKVLTINGTTTVKAMAVIAAKENSTVASATYTRILPSSSVAFSPTTGSVAVSATLPTSVSTAAGYDGTVTYTSNKTGVATVDASGKITGVAAGTATITATAPATANYAASTATFTVTVVNTISPEDRPYAIAPTASPTQYLNTTITKTETDGGACISAQSNNPSPIRLTASSTLGNWRLQNYDDNKYVAGYTNSESKGWSTVAQSGTYEWKIEGTNTNFGIVRNGSTQCVYVQNSYVYSNGTTGTTDPKSFLLVPYYACTISDAIANGTVSAAITGNKTADGKYAMQGATVTLSNTPAAGYDFVSYSVTKANGEAVTVTDGKFTMPASDVTISATFAISFTATYFLPGTWNGWATTDAGVGFDKDNKLTLALGRNTTYNFKFYNSTSGTWSGVTTGTIITANDTKSFNAGENCQIQTDLAGDYVFTLSWDDITPVITVTYPSPTDTYYLPGTWNGWNTSDQAVKFSVEKRVTLALEANTTYSFKFYNHDYESYSGNAGTMTSANCTNWDFDADANCGIQTTIAGPYVFTYNWKGDVPVITALYPHSITINAEHGTVKASSESAQFGTNIILTLKPDDGFMLKTITAVDGAGNAIAVEGTGSVRDFVMPSSDVTITAVFEEALSTTNYYYIRNVSTDKYIKFQNVYTESNVINATPLVANWTDGATYFKLTKSGDTYSIGTDGYYLTVSTSKGWNTSYSTTQSYVWTIKPTGGLDTDGSAIYNIQSSAGYLKYDGTNLYAYTDGAATYAAGSNYNAWVFVRADKEYKVVVTGLDNPTQGGVTYGGAEKHNGDTFNGVAVTSADLAAIAVDDYNAQISLSGTTITVNYTNYYTVSCDIYEGGVKWDGVEYYDGDKIYTTGKTASDFTGIAVSGYNAPGVTITGSTIVVTYAINMSGYTTSEVSEGWFLLYYPGKSAYVKDDGNTFVMASGPTKSEDFYNYLFHVTGSAGAYNIQSKLGNYFYLSNGGCSHVDHTPHNFTITQSGTRIEIKDNTTSAYAAGDAVGGKFLGSSTSVSYRLFKVQDTHALLMAEALVGNELFDLNGSAEIAIDNATPATTATISDVIANFSKTVADGGYTTAQKTVAIASLHAATSDPAYYNMPEGRYMLRNLEGMENTHNADCFLTSLTNPMGLAKEVVGYWSIWDFAKTANGTYTIANEGNKNILTPTLTLDNQPNERNDGYLCYDESRAIHWRVGNANNAGKNTNEFVVLPGVLRYGAERRHFAVFQPSTTPAEDKGSDKLHYRYLAMDFTGNSTYKAYYRADHVAKSASIALMDKEVFWQVIPVKPTNTTDEYGTIEGEGNMFSREINNLAGYVGGVVTLSNVSSVPSLNFIRQLADHTTLALVNGTSVSYGDVTYEGSDRGAKAYRRIIEKIYEIQTTPALKPFYQQLQPKDSIDHPFFLESLCSTRPGPSARLTENATGANKEKLQWVTDYKGAVTTGAGVFYVEKSAAQTTYHYVKDGADATATDNYYVLKNHNNNYLKKYVDSGVETTDLWIRQTENESEALQFVITPVIPGIWQIQDINMPKTGDDGSISENDDVYLTITDTEGGKSGTEYGLLHYRVSETTTLWRFVTSNVLKDIHLNGPVDGTYFGTFANDLNVTIDCSGNAEDLKVFYCSKAEREGPDLYVTFSPVDNHDGDHFELQGGIGYLLVSSKTPVTGLNYYAGIPEPQYDYTDILQPVPASGLSINGANQYDIFSLGYASTTTLLGYYFGMPVYGKGVGFYQFPAGTTLTPGKSYIERDKFVDRSSGSSSSVKGEVELAVEILLEEEDGTTSVFMPTADGGLVPIHKDGIYDLTGRRVEKPVCGIYISNGKKYICK